MALKSGGGGELSPQFFVQGAISLGIVVEPFLKIVVNLSRAYEELHCKGGPYRFRDKRNPLKHTKRQTHILLLSYFFKNRFFCGWGRSPAHINNINERQSIIISHYRHKINNSITSKYNNITRNIMYYVYK